jgi:DNA-directed RNA polymerase subunit K/omega
VSYTLWRQVRPDARLRSSQHPSRVRADRPSTPFGGLRAIHHGRARIVFTRGCHMVALKPVNAFEFVVISALRAAQLARGCAPRVAASDKVTVTARREVIAGHVTRLEEPAS